jgi:outer membrane protein OmpA-like peptidoglycan-associated protein
VYLELEGRSFLRSGFAAGSTPAEWRVGGTLCPLGTLAVDLAGGGALTNGVGAPRARFLFGFGWSPAACGGKLQPALAAVAPAPAPAAAPAPVAAPPPPVVAAPPAKEPAVADLLPLPPPDRDGDGIPDADDACPDQPGPRENQGCPRSMRQRVVVSASKIEILDKVLFALGKARIDPRSYSLLDQVAAVLDSHPDLLLVQVDGHTDDAGSPSRNLLLSQSRARSVVAYLESKGVDSKRLRAKGFGQSQPIDTNHTVQGRAANRRVAFTVLKMRARTIEADRPSES